MRGRIIRRIFERMKTDADIFFLTADMGINLVEIFQDAFPDRFLNVGIAEQNLIGIAAGLCNVGYRPFAYTISNFVTQRCLEQIRNDIVLHDYPVTLLGTSTGFDNAPLGPTHHIVDDWGSLRALPGIEIYCPSSIAYAETIVDRVLGDRSPVYIRIPKGAFTEPASTEDVAYARAPRARVLLVSYGSPAQNCLTVAAGRDDVSVMVVNRLRPIPASVEAALRDHEIAIVVEDQFPDSGLYGLLCQFCMEGRLGCRLASAAPRGYTLRVGSSAAYFEKVFGIDTSGIEWAIRCALDESAPART